MCYFWWASIYCNNNRLPLVFRGIVKGFPQLKNHDRAPEWKTTSSSRIIRRPCFIIFQSGFTSLKYFLADFWRKPVIKNCAEEFWVCWKKLKENWRKICWICQRKCGKFPKKLENMKIRKIWEKLLQLKEIWKRN